MTKSPIRRFNVKHIDMLHAYFDGVDFISLGEKFLETGPRRLPAERTCKTLIKKLTQAARQKRKFGSARALNLPPKLFNIEPRSEEGLTESNAQKEFLMSLDPENVLTTYEQQQAWYRVTRLHLELEEKRTRRAARLVSLKKRQHDALSMMSEAMIEIACPCHYVDEWLDEDLCLPLQKAGIHTFADLLSLLNVRGLWWISSVPQMGRTKGDRLVGWLVQSEIGLQREFSHKQILLLMRKNARGTTTTVEESNQEAISDIAPLERFEFPKGLEGVPYSGSDNSQGCTISARDDRGAIEMFLNQYTVQSSIWTAYRSEIERLALWMVVTRQKPFSSVSLEDVKDYCIFLANPEPVSTWVSKESYPRTDPRWRPFRLRRNRLPISANANTQIDKKLTSLTPSYSVEERHAGLSPKSVRRAITMLAHAFKWLEGVNYLVRNPFSTLISLSRNSPFPMYLSLNDEEQNFYTIRSLRAEHVAYLLSCTEHLACENLEETIAVHRLKLLLLLGFRCGLRISEISKATTGDLEDSSSSKDLKMILRVGVRANRHRKRSVILPSDVVVALRSYLSLRGLDNCPTECPPRTPLVSHVESSKPMEQNSLYIILKDFFDKSANKLDASAPAFFKKALLNATPNSLRNGFGFHYAMEGMPPASLAMAMGVSIHQIDQYYKPVKK